MTPPNSAAKIFEAIQALPRREQLRLVERIVHNLAGDEEHRSLVVGCSDEEAELLDAVVEDAMLAREHSVPRRGGA
jgi:hypothetical protein